MKSNVRLLLFTFIIFLAFLAGDYSGKRNASDNFSMLISEQHASDVYKAVAHVDMSWNKDLKRIYVDYENDAAYYIYSDGRDFPNVGDIVTVYTGEQYEITYTDINQFMIKPLESNVVEVGYSGTAIMDKNGNQIGLISELSADGIVRCIWS